MNDFDKGIIEAGKMLRQGYAALEGSISKIIAAITGALAVLLTFAEIAPPSIVSSALGLDLAVMLIASYIIYFSLEDAGERLGRTTDEYKGTKDKFRDLVGKIEPSMIERLRAFLADYIREEQAYRIAAAMTYEGISDEMLTEFKNGRKFDRKKMRALKRIAAIKPIDISVRSLLGEGGIERGGKIINPTRGKLVRLALKLIPSTLCLIFTVSVMITAKEGIDIGAIISGIVKLSTLPIIGLKGYSAGYAYTTESEIAWIATKARLIEAFFEREERSLQEKDVGLVPDNSRILA